jgi:hypothetical protein
MTDAEKMAASRVVAEAVFGPLMLRWCVHDPECGGFTDYERIISADERSELEAVGDDPYGMCQRARLFCYCTIHTRDDCSTWEEWKPIPDLFAATPEGAWAREQAAGWLLAQGIGDMGVWHSSSLAFYFDEPTWFVKIGTAPRCSGETIGEATAYAIHAAVVALGVGAGESPPPADSAGEGSKGGD